MKNIDFKDPAQFHQLEVQAYTGVRCYDSFPAAEYKYFDKLRCISYDYKYESLPADEASRRKSLAFKEYQNEVAEREQSARAYADYQQNLLRAGSTLSDTMKAMDTESYRELFLHAMYCISCMTGEMVTYDKAAKRAEKDVTQ